MTTKTTRTPKTRTLYSVRYYRTGQAIGTTVGHKCRLVPLRIARRLQRCGLEVQLAQMVVRVTPEQVGYLERRYG
ncbi:MULTISPECIES: hypothetical protein [Burkholderiaceae]|uniref:hypothetical protein n=1 Tax=Burkholderiaceae TaxID=119060 RepID=UPI001616AE86|nr:MULTISPECIES: hypothetical protein [Burkholderiaceae]MBB2981544.1 hypothetical protein [Paraburkholderia tropica]